MQVKFRANAWLRLWLLLMLTMVFLVGASREVAAASGDLVQGEVVSLGIGGINGLAGKYRPGAWVPVRVRLENRSGKQLAVRLGVEQVDLDGDKVLSLGQKIILDTTNVEGRDSWIYYWPRPDDELRGASSVVVLDESGSQVLATIPAPAPKSGLSNVGLPQRDPDSMQACRWVVVLGPQWAGWGSFNKSYGGTEATWVSFVDRADGLPDNALGLDGVDTIFWEADKIRVSDLPADFQLKAILDWVRSGGHLIISVSTQAQEFLKGGDHLAEAMPITFTGLREVDLRALAPLFGNELRLSTAKISQATGQLRPDAKMVANTNIGAFNDNPLAVTGTYGRGAVTVLTIDASNPDLNQGVAEDHNWMGFWNRIVGWQGRNDQMMSQNEYNTIVDAAKKKINANNDTSVPPPVTMPPNEIDLGHDIPQQIDVAEFTHLGIAVAVLFLGIYWLAAGPIGHLVLRMNKVVHWSWWIFGATVIVATFLAGVVVMFVHLTNYDLRHKTYVLGTVNSQDVSAVGYYGVFAPVNGKIEVDQPVSGTPADPIGINYLAPLDVVTPEGVKPFADPQTYDVVDETPNTVAPVFRSTLKKLQGRWTGKLPGIDGTAEFVASGNWGATLPIKGTLTNHTGYDLYDVELVIRRPMQEAQAPWPSYLFRPGDGKWKSGEAIDLAKSLTPEFRGTTRLPINLGELLNWMAHYRTGSNTIGVHMGPGQSDPFFNNGDAVNAAKNADDELGLALFSARIPDALNDQVRVEPAREFARAADATKLLNAAGAVIIARAGDIARSDYVASPVPITVNNRRLPGKGEITFVWALPLTHVTATIQENAIPTGNDFNSHSKNVENP
ncbi:MAG: hypothetical protein ACTHN5_21260 [Phycisphaerae bacterium]